MQAAPDLRSVQSSEFKVQGWPVEIKRYIHYSAFIQSQQRTPDSNHYFQT